MLSQSFYYSLPHINLIMDLLFVTIRNIMISYYIISYPILSYYLMPLLLLLYIPLPFLLFPFLIYFLFLFRPLRLLSLLLHLSPHFPLFSFNRRFDHFTRPYWWPMDRYSLLQLTLLNFPFLYSLYLRTLNNQNYSHTDSDLSDFILF